MHPILERTVGGLKPSAYVRHFLFGLMFPALALFIDSQVEGHSRWSLYVWMALSTLLYPYARHAYESVAGYIMGKNVFFTSAYFGLSMKLFTMIMCWGFAVFVAPIGMLVLYFQTRPIADTE